MHHKPHRRTTIINKQTIKQHKKYKKILIIIFPNTIPNPWTMMIELLNTIIALPTMRHTRWSKDITRMTELHIVFASSNECEFVFCI